MACRSSCEICLTACPSGFGILCLPFESYEMSASILKDAASGSKTAEKNELVQKLVVACCKQHYVVNQIKAAQWNNQGAQAAGFTQLLASVAPEAACQPTQYQARQNQAVQPFPQSYQIAERISVFGRRVPSDYNEMFEYSQIDDPQTQETYQNAKSAANACETFAQTSKNAVKLAHQAEDPLTMQVLAAQLQTAEQLTTQLRRFE